LIPGLFIVLAGFASAEAAYIAGYDSQGMVLICKKLSQSEGLIPNQDMPI